MLPLRMVDEARLLTNLTRNGRSRVRLIISGGPRLEERLASPKLESFNQRVAARCYLQAFIYDETLAYIRAQVSGVGGNADRVFAHDALAAVHRATDGIPRLINQVCDRALIVAFDSGIRQINPAVIEEAWADLQQLPTPWNAAPALWSRRRISLNSGRSMMSNRHHQGNLSRKRSFRNCMPFPQAKTPACSMESWTQGSMSSKRH